LLKTAWLYDVRLQNYGVINFVPFFGPLCRCIWFISSEGSLKGGLWLFWLV